MDTRREGMDSWKRSFLDKLSQAQSGWVKQFEASMDASLGRTFEEFKEFLVDNGFNVSRPMRDEGRRSYKFELAENAYLLLIFRSTGVGEFEIRTESFVPGRAPEMSKSIARINDLTPEWSREQFQSSLDAFVQLLAGEQPAVDIEELVTV